MENPRTRAKSQLHWENPRARECLGTSAKYSLLLAELIREYLDFYRLEYSKQIFVPETNLTTKKESSKDELIEQAGLKADEIDERKPLLLQILEKFFKGGKSLGAGIGDYGAKDNKYGFGDPGNDFSDEKL